MNGDVFGLSSPIEELRTLNRRIAPILEKLKATPYFRTYKVNLERECPFWAQQRLCNNNKCVVCECEEKEIPIFWKQ
jgi:ERO1-like protein alpha